MRKEVKITMLATFLLLSFMSINVTSATTHNISATSYGNYFNESGYIKNVNIKAGDVLDLYGTIQDKNMYIDRPLNIISSSKNGKIINGTITILSGGSGSNVTGLKINNSRDELMGIILLGSDNNTLKGNTIQSDGPGGHGISLAGSDYNHIVGNNMSSFGAEYDEINFQGVGLKPGWRHSPLLLQNSNHNNIMNNYVMSTVSNCIYLSGYGGDSYTSGLNYYNNIINNTCIGVDNSWCYAIQMMGSNNRAENNTITVSDLVTGVYGKGTYRGISSEGSNTIIGNTIYATFCGIFASSDSVISGNTVIGYKDDRTTDYTDYANTGIAVDTNCTVSDNIINMPHGGYGIYVTGSNCNITENNINTTDINKETIYLYGPINNINIEDNTINSKSTGIILKKMSTTKYPTQTTISNNHITTASTYAINTSEAANNTITNNYLVSNNGTKWGDEAIKPGTGDVVNGNTPASVTLTPGPGYYKNSVQVTLKMNKPGTIYYTLNGTTPTTSGAPYNNEIINITKTTTIKFITVDAEGNTSPIQSRTYTIDTKTPTITSIDPANGATKVATSKTIKVTFNENIKTGSKLWVELKNSSGKAVPFKTSISGKVLTIDPTSNLPESLYTLIIHTGAVTDLAGNPVALKTSKFSVGTAPTVSKVDPKNGATKIAASKTIKVTFNENIKAGGKFWVELKNSSGKVISSTNSASGKVLTVNPKSNLAESLYTLCIHTGAVTDLAGNPVALKNTKFSVGTAPKLSKVDPKNGATKVTRSKTIKVTFNENIKAGKSYWIELKTSSGKAVKITKSISGKVLTIKHTAKLATNTKYKLILHTGAVTDKAGNPVAVKTYTFTTGRT